MTNDAQLGDDEGKAVSGTCTEIFVILEETDRARWRQCRRPYLDGHGRVDQDAVE